MSSEHTCQASVDGWERFTFLGKAVNYSKIQDVVNDPEKNWGSYYNDEVLPKTGLPLTLALIWAVILMVYITWRLVLLIERCCCKIKRGEQMSNYSKYAEILSGRISLVTKVILFFFGVCACGWYVYGLATLVSEPNVAANAFDVVQSFQGQLELVVDKGYGLSGNFMEVPVKVQQLNETVKQYLDDTEIDRLTKCVIDGYQQIPDVSTLQDDVSNLQQIISEQTSPAVDSLSTNVPELQNDQSLQLTVFQASTSQNKINSALSNVTQALENVQNAKNDVLNNAMDNGRVSLLLLRLRQLSSDYQQLQQYTQNIQEMQQALAQHGNSIERTLQDIQSLSESLSAIQQALPTLKSNAEQVVSASEEVQPCLNQLVDKLTTFNNTIISLPKEAAQLLNQAQEWNQQFGLVGLVKEFNNQILKIQNLTETSQSLPSQQGQQVNVSSLAVPLQELVTTLNSGNSLLEDSQQLQEELQTYLNSPSSFQYSQVQDNIEQALGQIDSTEKNAQQWQSSVQDANNVLESYHNMMNEFDLDLSNLQNSIPSDTQLQQVQQVILDLSSLQDQAVIQDLQQLASQTSKVDQQFTQSIDQLQQRLTVVATDASTTINSSMLTLQADVVQPLSEFIDDHRSDAEQVYSTVELIGVYILFPLIIATIVAAIFCSIFNFTVGMEISAFLTIIVTLLIVIVGLVAANTAIVENDVCANIKIVVVNKVKLELGKNDVIAAFIEHVFYGNQGGIESILKRYFDYNNDKILDNISQLNNTVIEELQEIGSFPGERIDAILNFIGQLPTLIDVILNLLSYTQLNVFYLDLEDVACCQLRDFVTNYNTVVVLGAFLTIPVIIAMTVWLHYLRKLPISRLGCGICDCRSIKEFNVQLPQVRQ